MSYPTHLTCPFCPAQAFPAMLRGTVAGLPVRLYVCSQSHKFYVHPEVEEKSIAIIREAA